MLQTRFWDTNAHMAFIAGFQSGSVARGAEVSAQHAARWCEWDARGGARVRAEARTQSAARCKEAPGAARRRWRQCERAKETGRRQAEARREARKRRGAVHSAFVVGGVEKRNASPENMEMAPA